MLEINLIDTKAKPTLSLQTLTHYLGWWSFVASKSTSASSTSTSWATATSSTSSCTHFLLSIQKNTIQYCLLLLSSSLLIRDDLQRGLCQRNKNSSITDRPRRCMSCHCTIKLLKTRLCTSSWTVHFFCRWTDCFRPYAGRTPVSF